MPVFSRKRSQETVLKPGLVLPSGGITHQQAAETIQVVQDEDKFLVLAFQGVLCLFLLEISIAAYRAAKRPAIGWLQLHHV
ncbi:hypothetical protein [Mycobacterium lepromatosis]